MGAGTATFQLGHGQSTGISAEWVQSFVLSALGVIRVPRATDCYHGYKGVYTQQSTALSEAL